MYRAKENGRNRYVFYDTNIEKKSLSRAYFEEVLYSALENNEFFIEYQLQVDIATGKLRGVEALVRIHSKDYGVISPNDFIPLAEELGLIAQIDEWVFQESCRQHHIWKEKGYENTRISVNLSASQLKSKEIVNNYITIINKYNVNPSEIELEITENALIENEDIALEILEDFKKYGIKIAIDDFGTGYSSLICINIYPIDIVKIDRTFIKDAILNYKNEAIISTIVHMAKKMDLKVIAEGVETREQYEKISLLGCEEIQGYYFSKPCSPLEIEVFLQKDFSFKKVL